MDNKAYNIKVTDFNEKLKEKIDEDDFEYSAPDVLDAPSVEKENLNTDYEIVKRRLKKKCVYLCFKRLLDIISSFLGIIILGMPMIVIAIVVKCTSKGPAIFKQEKYGKNNKKFTMLKFRTMRLCAPHDSPSCELCNPENYITKTGNFLRKTSLDELPQLFNILVGQMSVIGPRPCIYDVETDLQNLRIENGSNLIKPGLTGLAQVNGRDITASLIEKKAKYDGEYAKKIGFWLDAKIFFVTIGKVFRRECVVEGDNVTEEENTDE